MKTRLLYFLLCLSTFSGRAYSQTLKGTVIDETQQAVAFANIVLLSLPDSAFVQGTITDEQGQFTFNKIDSDEKLLQISYIGYKLEYSIVTDICINKETRYCVRK